MDKPKSKAAFQKLQNIELVSLDLIDPPSLDMRITHDTDKIDELARSIKSVGLLQPITLTPTKERYEIVFGYRRYKAIQRTGAIEIKAIVVEWPLEKVIAARAIENLDREQPTPFEESRYVFEMLTKLKCSNKHLAKLLNKSEAWISQRGAVINYPDMLLKSLQNGQISFSVARVLYQVDELDTLAFYLTNAKENGITPRVAEAWVSAYKLQKKMEPSDREEPHIPDDIEADIPLGQPCHFCQENKQYALLKSIWSCKSCLQSIIAILIDLADKQKIEEEG